MDRQMRLAEMNDEFGAARTNKKEFLEKMDAIIPWSNFITLVKPFYYKGERGNRPYELELMLRIFMLQNFYDLADMKAMNEILEAPPHILGFLSIPFRKNLLYIHKNSHSIFF